VRSVAPELSRTLSDHFYGSKTVVPELWAIVLGRSMAPSIRRRQKRRRYEVAVPPGAETSLIERSWIESSWILPSWTLSA
jgi:hypothetical protein